MLFFPCSISTRPWNPQLPSFRLRRERRRRGSRFPPLLALLCGRSWCWIRKRRTSSLQFYECKISETSVSPFTCMLFLLSSPGGCLMVHGRQLHSARPPLSDVPAIYFVSPTLQNIRRIAQDLGKGLYESFNLNFSEPLPRSLLEELAAAVAKDGTNELVEQVSTPRCPSSEAHG